MTRPLLPRSPSDTITDLERRLARVELSGGGGTSGGGGSESAEDVEGGEIISYDPDTGIASVLLDSGLTVDVTIVPVGTTEVTGGGNENPIDFLGSASSETLVQLSETGGNILSQVKLRADDGTFGMAILAARTFTATPEFNGGILSLYSGDGLGGIFAHAFATGDTQISVSASSGQTEPLLTIGDHDHNNDLFEVTATGAVDLLEQSTPAAPAVNTARVFARDSPSTPGKTQLCVIFNTGAVQVIATQP